MYELGKTHSTTLPHLTVLQKKTIGIITFSKFDCHTTLFSMGLKFLNLLIDPWWREGGILKL